MNILFVQSLGDIQSMTKPLQTQQQIQFGISYISSLLKKHGHNTELVILSRNSDRKSKGILNECLKNFCPKLICFTAVATEYNFIAKVAKYVKDNHPDIYLLIGGPHASLKPQEVLSGDFDALCVGEGENPTIELVTQLETGKAASGIANLWIKHGSEIERNSPRPFIQDLDSLPYPDREMWLKWIKDKSAVKNSVLISRGCPFSCSYCCNHAFRKLAPGPYVRFRSADNIIEEIKQIIARFPATKEIFLEAEAISLNKEWAIELCARLEELNTTLRQPLSFGANIRIIPGADLEELFAAFKKTNFHFINIGVESGSERVRHEILKRDYSNEDIINTAKSARKYGLKIAFFNMVGLPGETVADFKETVKINRTCLPDKHYTSIFFPYPGTELYSLCTHSGLLKKPLDTTMERKTAVLDLPDFPKKQIQKSFIWFNYYVYKGLKPKYKIFTSVLRAKLASKNYLNSLYRKLTNLIFLRPTKRHRKPLKNPLSNIYGKVLSNFPNISKPGQQKGAATTQKLNILWIASSYKKGLLYHFVQLAKKFKQRGHHIIMLSSPDEQVPRLIDQLRQNDILLYESNYIDQKSIKGIFKGAEEIRKIVTEEDIQIIQANGFYHLIKSYLALKNTSFADKVIIATSLHSVRHGSWLEIPTRIIGSKLLNRFTTIAIPVSEQERDKMIHFGLNADKAVTVYNAIDFETLEKSTVNEDDSLIKKIDLKNASVSTIAYFANLIPRKGHKYLLYAAKEVLKTFPKTKFLLVGDGTYRNRLEALIRKLQISQNVAITGWLESKFIRLILANIDIAVVASLSETFCYAIIEPMAAGVPVITTPVGVAPEIIESKKNGMLIPPKNPKAIADSIIYLLRNRQTAKQIGLAGKELVNNKFNIDTIISMLEQLYFAALCNKTRNPITSQNPAIQPVCPCKKQTISVGQNLSE